MGLEFLQNIVKELLKSCIAIAGWKQAAFCLNCFIILNYY